MGRTLGCLPMPIQATAISTSFAFVRGTGKISVAGLKRNRPGIWKLPISSVGVVIALKRGQPITRLFTSTASSFRSRNFQSSSNSNQRL
jgi:hypothetical protein